MKNTALLIDTNIILDWLMRRQPFMNEAKKVIEFCINGSATGYLACHSIPNVLYIIRKDCDVTTRKEIGLMLCEKFEIIGIDKQRIVTALQNNAWDDIEDGLQMQSAFDESMDYIITRDPKGFASSRVQAISPKDYLNLLEIK